MHLNLTNINVPQHINIDVLNCAQSLNNENERNANMYHTHSN